MRTESDSIGSMRIPDGAYYGIQSMRAKENFPMTGERMRPEMIRSLACIKKAAAIANCGAGTLDEARKDAIVAACDEIIAGYWQDQFIVDPIQGGAGTSANMNANEVIANRATELMGGKPGEYLVHPNDHVNMAQSTNDVFPTAGKLTTLTLLNGLELSLGRLIEALERKAEEFAGVLKLARTQLQDAVPIRLGQEFAAYATAIKRCRARIAGSRREMQSLNIGATAVGTSINATQTYLHDIVPTLSGVVNETLWQADDLVDATQNPDGFVEVSGAVKACALVMSKIANDMRLLSSGPKGGLEEIHLPARQHGSSIMPGKINPVIPEVVTQAAYRVAGNDTTIAMAAEAGQLELNAFEPVLLHCLFDSITLLRNAADVFVQFCVRGITADEAQCRELLMHSTAVATALCPAIGYEKATQIVKKALKEKRPIADVAREVLGMPADEIEKMIDDCLRAC